MPDLKQRKINFYEELKRTKDQYFSFEYQCRSCEYIFGLHKRMSLTPCPVCGEQSRRYFGFFLNFLVYSLLYFFLSLLHIPPFHLGFFSSLLSSLIFFKRSFENFPLALWTCPFIYLPFLSRLSIILYLRTENSQELKMVNNNQDSWEISIN